MKDAIRKDDGHVYGSYFRSSRLFDSSSRLRSYVTSREGEHCYYDERLFLLTVKQTYAKRITFVDKGDIFSTGRSHHRNKGSTQSKNRGMWWPTSKETKQNIANKTEEALLQLDKQTD
jgi:hypothetical protein